MSLAATWEDARREWEFTGLILKEGDKGFDPVCGLCHQPGLKASYEIRNIHTGRRLLVGDECIKHYLILRGAETVEDSRRLFNRQRRRAELVQSVLRPCATAVLSREPDWATVYRLHLAAQEYFGYRCAARFQELAPAEWRHFINQVLAGLPEGEALGSGDFVRLRNCILNPRKVASPPRSLMRNPSRRELVWGARRVRVETTLARGVDSKDPSQLPGRISKVIVSSDVAAGLRGVATGGGGASAAGAGSEDRRSHCVAR